MQSQKHRSAIIIICAVLLHCLAFSQGRLPVIKLPIGHTGNINTIDFSANGKLLATAGDDGSVILWDTRTGKAIRSLFIKGAIVKVLFSCDSKYLFVVEKGGLKKQGFNALSLWDVKTGSKIREYPFSGSEEMAISPVSSLILVPQQVNLMDAIASKFGDTDDDDKDEKGKTAEEIEDDKQARKMMAMFNFSTQTDSVFIFDYVQNKRVGSLKIGDYNDPYEGFSAKTRFLSFDNALYIIALENPDTEKKKSNRIRIWEIRNPGSPLLSISNSQHFTQLATAATGGYFAASSKNEVIIRNIKSGVPADSFLLKGENIEELTFSQNGSRLLCRSSLQNEQKIRIWDVKQRKFILQQAGGTAGDDPHTVLMAPQGNYFAFANKQEVSLTDVEGKPMQTLKGYLLNTYREYFSLNNRYLVPKPPSKEDKLNSLNWLKKYTEQLKPDEDDSKEDIAELQKAKREADSIVKIKKAELESGQDKMPVWDLLTGSCKWIQVPEGNLRLGEELIKTSNDTVSANKHFVLLNDSWYGYNMDDVDRGIENLSYLGAVGSDMLQHIHKTASLVSKVKYLVNVRLKDTLRLINIDSANWIIINKRGYFKTSRDAAALLFYVTDKDEVISFEQMDLKFNRPDLILEALENPDSNLIKAYRLTYENRLKQNNVRAEEFSNDYLVPEGDFTNRDEIQYNQTTGMIQLHYSAKANGTKISKFNLWVNAMPLFGPEGLLVMRKPNEGFDTSLLVSLSAGKNKIEASVTNENSFESYRMPLWVNQNASVPVASKTWFIGIGVNRYADPAHNNLRYSTNDIRALVTGFRNKWGADLIVDTLFNENFTEANLNLLQKKLANAKINDRIIMVYSGHGVLKGADYYFPISEMNKQDFTDPSDKAIPYQKLQSLLDKTVARNKLFLIDACKSGFKDPNDVLVLDSIMTNQIMGELFTYVGRQTGATVLTSSSGDEKSQESDQLKHGFFTQGILNALKEEKTISVSGLKNYLLKNVPLISRQLQIPTIRAENRESDFKVW